MAYKKTNPNGQATMANSEPVVLSSDHSDVKITLDGETVTVTATNLDVQSGGADLATSTQAGAIQTAVEIIDNAIHVDDAAYTLGTHSGIMMMGFAGTQSVNANDAGAIAMETDGAIHIHDGGNTITVDGTVAVTGVSTLAEQQTQTTHLATIAGDTTAIETAVQLIDDTVQVLGTDTYTEASSKGITLGAVRRDADTTLVNTTNEFTPLQVDANGRLKVEAFSGETLPVSLTSTTITGTVAVTQSGTWDEVGINDSGNSITVDNGGTFAVQVDGSALTALQLIDDTVFVAGTDTYSEATSKGNLMLGVRRDADTTLANTTNEFVPFQVDANGYLKVEIFDGGGTHTVDAPVGTPVNVQIGNGTISAGVIDETGASAVDALAVGGGTASDAVDSGNPIKIGMKAYELDGTAPQTAVAEADRVNAISDLVGRQYVATEHPRFWHASVDYASAQTNATIKAAPGASLALYITDIMISNGATAGNITLLDGSGGTVLFELYPAVNGGVSLNLKNPIKLTDNTLLAITSTTVTTHSVFVAGFVD